MSDGRLIFDTKIDKSGIKKDLPAIKKDIESNLSRAGDGFSKTGAKLTKYITKPALVAGAAVAGITIKKGWDRLTAIDDARAALEGLGHSAKAIDGIMESALASVKGTSFGLGAAASTAASAVASGIKPGQELTRYLSLVSDAAAIAGTDMNEMGAVFNKVAANGKLSAEELNMLTDRGIPALSLLAKASGKSVEQIRKDMAAGKISTEDFLSAIELGMGGAAKIMGSKSLRSAMANIGASLSRIGANFLDAGGKGGGAFSQLKPILASLAEWLEKIEEKSVKWGESFGKVFSVITKGFITMPNGIKVAIAGLAIGAGPMLKFTGATLKGMDALNKYRSSAKGASLVTGIFKGDISASQAILGKFGGRVAAAGNVLKTHGKVLAVNSLAHIKNTAMTVADTAVNSVFGRVVTGIGGKVAGATKSILSFAMAHRVALMATFGVIGALAALAIYMSKTGLSADQIAEKITAFADKAATTITAFAEKLPGLINALVPAFVSIISSLARVLPSLIPVLTGAFMTMLMALVDVLPQLTGSLTQGFISVVMALVDALPALVPALLQAGITIFMALVEALPHVLEALIAALPQIIAALVQAIIISAPAISKAGVTLFMALVKAIPVVIGAVLGALNQLKSALLSGLVNMLVAMWGRVKSGAIAGWNAIKSAVVAKTQAILDSVKAKARAIMSIFSFKGLAARVSSAWNAAKAAMIRPIEAAKSKLASIVKKIKNIFDKVKLKLHIKIPKISVKGGKAPFGIGGKGRLPSFSVHWARLGGIVDKATLLGAGEAGAEVIMPLNKFWQKMDALALSIISGMQVISESIKRWEPSKEDVPQPYAAQLINQMRELEQARTVMSGASVDSAIDKFANALANVKVTHILNCEGKVLATVTAPFMDTELKKIYRRQNRGFGHV